MRIGVFVHINTYVVYIYLNVQVRISLQGSVWYMSMCVCQVLYRLCSAFILQRLGIDADSSLSVSAGRCKISCLAMEIQKPIP